jgi:hypothetical protein
MNRSGAQACASDRPHFQREFSVVHYDMCSGESVGRNFTLSGLIRAEGRNV